MPLLPFISDEDLIRHTEVLLDAAFAAEREVHEDPYRNVIDPFSAIIDAARQNITLSEWMEQEKSRQVQKSMQNALGSFHQAIIGSMPGWGDMGDSGSFDVRNKRKKIIAEVKNKHNTMNSTSALGTYDKLANHIDYGEPGFKAFVVQIVPKNPKPYETPFTPTERGTRRPEREDVLRKDGYSFYTEASGCKNALELLYKTLPKVIEKISGTSPKKITGSSEFIDLFERAYIKK